jgi:hypothetical protein
MFFPFHIYVMAIFLWLLLFEEREKVVQNTVNKKENHKGHPKILNLTKFFLNSDNFFFRNYIGN